MIDLTVCEITVSENVNIFCRMSLCFHSTVTLVILENNVCEHENRLDVERFDRDSHGDSFSSVETNLQKIVFEAFSIYHKCLCIRNVIHCSLPLSSLPRQVRENRRFHFLPYQIDLCLANVSVADISDHR